MKRLRPSIIPIAACIGVAAMLIAAAVFSSGSAPVFQEFSDRIPLKTPSSILNLPQSAYYNDLTAQEWTAWAAIIATIISAVSLIILAGTLWTTRLMLMEAQDTAKAAWATVETTREIGTKQVRCYPAILGLQTGWMNGPFEPHIQISWQNAGSSPAMQPEISIRAFIDEFNGEDEKHHQRVAWLTYPQNDASAQSEIAILVPSDLEAACRPETNIRALSYIDIHFEVCLFAEDVFGKVVSSFRSFSVGVSLTHGRVDDVEYSNRSFAIPRDQIALTIEQHRQKTQRFSRMAIR